MHILDELKFGPDYATDNRVSCPRVSIKYLTRPIVGKMVFTFSRLFSYLTIKTILRTLPADSGERSLPFGLRL